MLTFIIAFLFALIAICSRLVNFWSNHFASCEDKIFCMVLNGMILSKYMLCTDPAIPPFTGVAPIEDSCLAVLGAVSFLLKICIQDTCILYSDKWLNSSFVLQLLKSYLFHF